MNDQTRSVLQRVVVLHKLINFKARLPHCLASRYDYNCLRLTSPVLGVPQPYCPLLHMKILKEYRYCFSVALLLNCYWLLCLSYYITGGGLLGHMILVN
jgi:hypothetical protein